ELGPIERISRDGELPLSYAQQRLWFLDQLEPGSASYNVAGAVRIEGVLDEEALEKTIRQIATRHESLRTRFIEVEGEPRQVVDQEVKVWLRTDDLRAGSVEEKSREALRLAREDAERPFDLREGHLLRAKLLRMDDKEHALLLTMHHIVSDGWS